jgi:hypothetical protein
LETISTQKSPANLNRFEKRSENLESQKTYHATSTTITSPPTTTTTSRQHQQSSPKPNPGDAKSEYRHHNLNSTKYVDKLHTSAHHHLITFAQLHP